MSYEAPCPNLCDGLGRGVGLVSKLFNSMTKGFLC